MQNTPSKANASPAKVSGRPLTKALDELKQVDQDSTLQLAKEISSLTLDRILNQQRDYKQKRERLVALRHAWREAQESIHEAVDQERMERKKSWLEGIEQEGKALRAELDHYWGPQALARSANQDFDGTVRRLMRLFRHFMGAFNLDAEKNISPQQAQRTAINLISDFPTLTIEDIALFLRHVEMGYYGEVYGRIDGPTLTSKLGQYQRHKLQKIEERNYREHISQRGTPSDSPGMRSIQQITATSSSDRSELHQGNS